MINSQILKNHYVRFLYVESNRKTYHNSVGPPGRRGLSGPRGARGQAGSGGSSVYTRWGKKTCPNGATLIYSCINTSKMYPMYTHISNNSCIVVIYHVGFVFSGTLFVYKLSIKKLALRGYLLFMKIRP